MIQPLGGHTRNIVLNQHIRSLYQFMQDLDAFFMLKRETYRLLVSVDLLIVNIDQTLHSRMLTAMKYALSPGPSLVPVQHQLPPYTPDGSTDRAHTQRMADPRLLCRLLWWDVRL
jgi:hypothetical protein